MTPDDLWRCLRELDALAVRIHRQASRLGPEDPEVVALLALIQQRRRDALDALAAVRPAAETIH